MEISEEEYSKLLKTVADLQLALEEQGQHISDLYSALGGHSADLAVLRQDIKNESNLRSITMGALEDRVDDLRKTIESTINNTINL